MSKINTQLIVIKKTQLNESQGFITPILSITENGDYREIDSNDYPLDIFISRGYGSIDKQYEENELFILKSHGKNEEKTREEGSPRYWAEENMVAPLSSSTLLPVLETTLPNKETGILSQGIEPPNGAFFILDGEDLYGPLKSSYTDQYVIEPNVNPSLSFGKGNLGKWKINNINSCLIECRINNETRSYIKSFKELSKYRNKNDEDSNSIDYLSDDQLIKFANHVYFGKKGLSRKEAEKLQQIITNYEKENKTLKDERLNRLKRLLDKYLTNGSNGYSIVKEYLEESSAGQKFLKQYVKENESRLLQGIINEFQRNADEEKQEIKKEIDSQRAQLKRYEEEIIKIQDKVNEERRSAKRELERIAQESEEQRQKKLEENQAELSIKIAEMEKQLETQGDELNRVCDKLEIANDLTELKKECEYYERDYEKQKIKIDTLIATYNDTITQNDTELYKRIGEMEAFNKLINSDSKNSKKAKPKDFPEKSISNIQPDSAADLINYLCSSFNEGGRSFTFDEMTNLMACVQQSFLTVLAGNPGTGKTSTVTRLSSAMNLGNSQLGDNFLNIPIGRGWASSRDILGFYNSLKDTYQESRSGLYSFLSHHQNNQCNAHKIVLLDEANLSSIEHYWSDFLIYCDYENLSRPIDTGHPDEEQRFLIIDDKTRFIATMNFDATTEKLSPRLIDRAPVIMLDNASLSHENEASSLELEGMLDANKIKKFFTPEDNTLLRSESILLHDTINILNNVSRSKGPTTIISQRKINAIVNYVSACRELIGSDTAMDFAISQFILPHIEGYGSSFRSRLEELHEKFSKHSRTDKHLERILSSGDYLAESYSFFG